jgi:hypothetical protein
MSRRRGEAHERPEEFEDEDADVDATDAWLEEQLKKTPWWLISITFHAVVLSCLGLVTFAQKVVFEETPITVAIAHTEPKVVAERPRDVMDHGGVETKDPDKSQEPTIFFPGAEVSDHNESANDDDSHEMKGHSYQFSSYLPGDDDGTEGRQASGRGVTDAMGIGGGGGSAGRYGGRRGGRRNLVARGGNQATESAVTAGLYWLARHQNPDGSWSAAAFDRNCADGKCSGPGDARFDVGVSGLSVLAFLGAGYTHLTRASYKDPHTNKVMSFGAVVRKGVQWLIDQQDATGRIGPDVNEYMYNHSIAALALAEAYGLTQAAVYKGPAQRAIDFVVQAQNPGLGWRYKVRPGDNDTSCTGWAVMALKSGLISGLAVPHSAFEGARTWIERSTDSTGLVGYNTPGNIDVFVPGANEAWCAHPSMTAIGVLLRIYIDSNQRDPELTKGAKLIVADKPVWDEAGHKIDIYYWYYATLALFQLQDAGGQQLWRQWNDAMKTALVPHQAVRSAGCADGSWPPEVDRWGFAGGRVYMTAINTMTLEVYYRYESVFGRQNGKRGGDH